MKAFRLSVFVCMALLVGRSTYSAERLVRGLVGVIPAEAPGNSEMVRISGTVLDAAGTPVEGAVVECYQVKPAGSTDMEVTQQVVTGTNGAFEVKGQRVLTVLLARKAGLAPGWNQFRSFTRDLLEETLVLTPPGTLAGTVVDEAGQPVANALVRVSRTYTETAVDGRVSTCYLSRMPVRDLFATRTAPDGKFRLDGFPTNTAADLAVIAPGKVTRQSSRDYISFESMLCRPGQQDVKVVLGSASAIEGKVTAQDSGQPVGGVWLSVQASRPTGVAEGSPEPVQSAADGTFRIADIAPGDWRVEIGSRTIALSEWVGEPVPVTVTAGQNKQDVAVSVSRGGFLEVSVQAKEDGRPLPNANILVTRQSSRKSVFSDNDGVARLRLPAGDYRVSAYRETTRSEEVPVAVALGETNRVEVEVSAPPKLVGTVRDAKGQPAAGVQVSIFGGFGPGGAVAKTDDKGHYELALNQQRYGLNDVSYCLIARNLERNLAAAQEIEEGATALDVQLQPALTILGRVEDELGTPLPGASIQVFLQLGTRGSQFDTKPIKSDAVGLFEIPGLPPERQYTIWARAKGYGSAYQSARPEETTTNRLELSALALKLANFQLAGRVVDAQEQPVAGANVSLSGAGQPSASVRSDQQGQFKFDSVCEGTAQVFASARSSYGTATATGGDTNVVVTLGGSAMAFREAPRRTSLEGKPLPDLAAFKLGADAIPAGKRVLLCLMDLEQRPSRRLARQLTEQHDALRQKGLVVVGLQTAVVTPEAFKEWKDANPVPFPVACLPEKSAETKWASGIEAFPWLILTDAERRVTAEGFSLEDLDAKLK